MFNRPGRRPPWWPDQEPWPPVRRWRRHPFGFAWRAAGFVLFVLLIPAAICLGTLWLLGLLGQPSTQISTVAWVALAAFGAGLFLLLFRAIRHLSLPLGELIEAAGQVEQGDYTARVQVRGPRELRLLGRAFNDMATRLELTEAQRRYLVADLSHELRTPVSVIQGNLEALIDGVYPADESHLGPVLEEVRLLSRLIDDLRTLSEAETGTLTLHREPTDLGVLIGELATNLRAQSDGQGTRLRVEVPDDLPLLEVDPVRIREVLTNLTTNALRHTPEGGQVAIRAAQADGYAQITVADTGSGIAPADLPHVFDRFYKSKESAGSGLGLTIAKNLVEAHGGTIAAKSTLGQGTEVRFTLPIEPNN